MPTSPADGNEEAGKSTARGGDGGEAEEEEEEEEEEEGACAAPNAAMVFRQLVSTYEWQPTLCDQAIASIDSSASAMAALAAGAGLDSLPVEVLEWCMVLLRAPQRPIHMEFDPLGWTPSAGGLLYLRMVPYSNGDTLSFSVIDLDSALARCYPEAAAAAGVGAGAVWSVEPRVDVLQLSGVNGGADELPVAIPADFWARCAEGSVPLNLDKPMAPIAPSLTAFFAAWLDSGYNPADMR